MLEEPGQFAGVRQTLPGVNGLPMSKQVLLRTRETSQAVEAIHQLVEPFSFSWERHAIHTDVWVTGVLLEQVHLFGVCHGAAVLVRSQPLQSNYIVVPLRGQVVGRIKQRSFQAVPGEALIFPAGCRLHADWTRDCIGIVLSIETEALERAARRFLPAASRIPPLMPRLRLWDGPGRSFANVLGCLCAECDSQQMDGGSSEVRNSLQHALLVSLLQAHGRPSQQAPQLDRASTKRRRKGIARAVDHLQANLRRPVSARELSGVACLSVRSLQIGFLECFGVGPSAYGKRLRLLKARADLQAADPRDTSVGRVAGRWGFQCTRTFSRLYRREFGELPSRTLRRRDESPGSEDASAFPADGAADPAMQTFDAIIRRDDLTAGGNA